MSKTGSRTKCCGSSKEGVVIEKFRRRYVAAGPEMMSTILPKKEEGEGPQAEAAAWAEAWRWEPCTP